MRRPKSHFSGPMRLRSGIFYFLLLMLLLEGIRYARGALESDPNPALLRLDAEEQAWIDSLKRAGPGPRAVRRYDPNGLDDFAAYRLGLSLRSLDALYAYRASGRTLYDAETLQQVASLPDSAMRRLLPRLRFPARPTQRLAQGPSSGSLPDLNRASAEQLRTIRGVGPVLSARIVKFREALGGFQHGSQLLDVYGLSPEVASRLMASFRVADPPDIRRVNLNTASAAELGSLLYLTRDMAEALVVWRQKNGPYERLDEIAEVLDLPRDKIERIALYLTL